MRERKRLYNFNSLAPLAAKGILHLLNLVFGEPFILYTFTCIEYPFVVFSSRVSIVI